MRMKKFHMHVQGISKLFWANSLFLLFRSVINKGHISHNQSLAVFTILGTTGKPHAVRLFPTESCTCPSTSRCYHILAARMSIGLEDNSKQKKINLTQLRRNTRARAEKKSGRKAPRPGDYEVLPAPDAICTQVIKYQNCIIILLLCFFITVGYSSR